MLVGGGGSFVFGLQKERTQKLTLTSLRAFVQKPEVKLQRDDFRCLVVVCLFAVFVKSGGG